MPEERIPQFIAAYRVLYQKNGAAYLRRARLFLVVPNLLVGGGVVLLLALWLAGTVAIALFQNLASLLVLLFTATISLPLVRVLSFRRTLSRTPNIYLTNRQHPSTSDGIVIGLIGFMILAGMASTFEWVPSVHVLLTLLGSGILFYVFQISFLLKEAARYYGTVAVVGGSEIPSELERRLHAEYDACALHAPGIPSVERVFLTNTDDIQIGSVTVAEKVRRHSLAIGLPLLQSVTAQQFRAMLLSECLSLILPAGKLYHRSVGRYVAWNRLLFNLASAFHWGRKLYLPFNDAIYTRLTAHLFFLARLARGGADRAVVDRGLQGALQDALANQVYKHRMVEKSVWSDIYRQADENETAPLEPFSAIQEELAGEQDREEAKLVLNESMMPWRDGMPLIPTPSERLGMLQANPFPPEGKEESAADYFFGEQLGEIIGVADLSWSTMFFDAYGDVITRRREARDELNNVLASVRTCGEGREKEKSQLLLRAGQIRGGLAEEDADVDASLDLYLRAVAADPDSAGARLAAARLMLSRDDREGLAMLNPILHADEIGEERIYAHTMALEYMRENGMQEEALTFEKTHLRSFTKAQETMRMFRGRAEEERRRIEPHDPLVHHSLDSAALEHVLRVLERYPYVANAVLGRKAVQFLPEYPFYLLGLSVERPPSRDFLNPGGAVLYAQQVAEELQFLRGRVGVVLLNDIDSISAQLRSVPNSLIYRREK